MAGADRVAEWQQSITAIRDPEDHSDDPPLIAPLYQACSAVFRDIITHLSSDSSVDKSVQLSLQRSQSYLVLWADGYGVSDGLLDMSLDKSRRARATTLRLLFSVSQTLTKRLFQLVPEEHRLRLSPKVTDVALAAEKIKFLIEHDDNGDSDSDGSSDSSSQPEADDLDEIAEDLLTDTQCLMDLGSRFQEEHVGPVNIEPAVSAAQLVTWDPSMNFVDRVRWRYPQCEMAVAERLGKANWARVLRHRETVSENTLSLKDPVPAKPTPSQGASTTFRDSALGSSVPSVPLGIPGLDNGGTEYAETMVSYRAGQGDSVRVPPLPDGAHEGKPFGCVGCGLDVTMKTKSAWKKHLFLDLKPYICLEGGCSFDGLPFDTKAQWKDHLSLEHGYPNSSMATSECPVCQEDISNSQTAVIVHLARHLEEVALTVLPTNLDSEDGTDLDSGLASSENSTRDSHESIGGEPDMPDSLTMGDIYNYELYSPNVSIASASPTAPEQSNTPPSQDLFTQRLQAANSQRLSAPDESSSLSPFKEGSPLVPVFKSDSAQSRAAVLTDLGMLSGSIKPKDEASSSSPTLYGKRGRSSSVPGSREPSIEELSTDEVASCVQKPLQAHMASVKGPVATEAPPLTASTIPEPAIQHDPFSVESLQADATRATASLKWAREPTPTSPSSVFTSHLGSDLSPSKAARLVGLTSRHSPAPTHVPLQSPNTYDQNPSFLPDVSNFSTTANDGFNLQLQQLMGTNWNAPDATAPLYTQHQPRVSVGSGQSTPGHHVFHPASQVPPSNELSEQRVEGANDASSNHAGTGDQVPGASDDVLAAIIPEPTERDGRKDATTVEDNSRQTEKQQPGFQNPPMYDDEELPAFENSHRIRSRLQNTTDEYLSFLAPDGAVSTPHELAYSGLDGHIEEQVLRKMAAATSVRADPADTTTTPVDPTLPETKQLSRPWKCPILTCKYHEHGWPTEKELNRHVRDKHSSAPAVYECLYQPCPYKSKRESNCKQHMEKSHGWKHENSYRRSATTGTPRPSGGDVNISTPAAHTAELQLQQQKTDWPNKVRSYEQRSFESKNVPLDVSREELGIKLKETTSHAMDYDGVMYTTDWDSMPLP